MPKRAAKKLARVGCSAWLDPSLRIGIEACEDGSHIVRLLSYAGIEEVYAAGGISHTLRTVERLIPSLRHSLAQIRSEPVLGRAA